MDPHPLYNEVKNDLGTDPEEQTEISHGERFMKVVQSSPSKLFQTANG